jgi:hypothetical protein
MVGLSAFLVYRIISAVSSEADGEFRSLGFETGNASMHEKMLRNIKIRLVRLLVFILFAYSRKQNSNLDISSELCDPINLNNLLADAIYSDFTKYADCI